MKKVEAPQLINIKSFFKIIKQIYLFGRGPKETNLINPYSLSIILLCLLIPLSFFNTTIFIFLLCWVSYLVFQYFKLLNISKNLSVRRKMSPNGREGQELTIVYTMANRSSFSLENYSLLDEFKGTLASPISLLGEKVLKGGRKRRLVKKVLLDNGMGIKPFEKLSFSLWDPFGIFYFQVHFELNQSIEVFPLVHPKEHPWDKANEETARFGVFEVPKKGDSTNFIGLREYREGDPIRYINWLLSSRHQTLLINEFDKLVDAHTVVYFNDDIKAHVGEGANSTLEYSKDLFLMIAQSQLEQGNEFRLVLPKKAFDLGSGLSFYHYLERFICNLELKRHELAKDRPSLLIDAIPSGASVVYLSPIHQRGYLREDLKILKKIASQGQQVVVVFFDALSFAQKNIESEARVFISGIKETLSKKYEEMAIDLQRNGVFCHRITIGGDYLDSFSEMMIKHKAYLEVMNEK